MPVARGGLEEGGRELAGVGVPDADQAVPAAGGGAAAVVRERRGVLPLGRARQAALKHRPVAPSQSRTVPSALAEIRRVAVAAEGELMDRLPNGR